ncbi:NADH-quinone oxidoreductase subunit G [Pseudonocardiaceae bacterium YIM PH 21723]|nr:NADH-quinone oxidoreductase subunit G [Pseudonocardiaceae bacterium YIM PH 21723]
MTLAADKNTDIVVPDGHVKLTIDGAEVVAPKGELLIRTAERLGTVIPRFCDHPLLEPAGACRQCLVEVEMGGRPMPKPQASCTLTVADGMVVKTQLTSPVADKAQAGVMELLLINHPLDCPICDKGGECPLQNQALKHGRTDSRFTETKRTFPKPIAVSSQVLLDRERCVLCQRCTRFSEQIAGDPFIELLERGSQQQIGTAQDQPFQSYFSGNTIQICPVGALTSAAYRFRSRPFDLVSTPSVCEHCAGGCATRTDWRRGKITRRLAAEDPQVNEEWICDKGRFAFTYTTEPDRLLRPRVRDAKTGELRDASWTEALRVAAEGLTKAKEAGGVGVLPGGRLTVEDAYAYSKFARVALGTNDIDYRNRPSSAEELAFLGSTVSGTNPEHGVTYGDIEKAPAVLLIALEPEEEAPGVFLRLRKGNRKHGNRVFHMGQWTTPAVVKTNGTLIPCLPGEEADMLGRLPSEVDELLRRPDAVILLGERAAEITGLFSTARELAAQTGAKLAWIPRRAGELAAIEAGALPTMLPGGRPVTDSVARAEVELAWGLETGTLPTAEGRDLAGILGAVANGRLAGLVIGSVDVHDLPNPELAERALDSGVFVVSLDLRESSVTRRADVVLPVAAISEKAGTYINWEGRRRPFPVVITGTNRLPDCRVLDTLAVEMDADLFTQTPAAAMADLGRLGHHTGNRIPAPSVDAGRPNRPGQRHAVLATWHQLIDHGSMQDGEPHLAGTARPAVARLSVDTAKAFGVADAALITVGTDRGSVTLLAEFADLPEGVVWLPSNSTPATVRTSLGAGHGALVTVTTAANGAAS